MSAPSDLCRLSAAELHGGFREKTFTPSDVLSAVEARIDRVNGEINAIIAEDRKASRAAARAATERWESNAPLSTLDGVPVSVKDNIHVAGLPATWGSRIHQDFRPVVDEPPIARLRAAGAVLFAKTNVPEFTLQGYTGNAVFGVTRNPLAPDRTPGGSTGGGAAAVAAGMGAIAIGTDGGGSLRRPAAHCGVFGFKPSLGQIARSGGFPQILADFEVLGPIARSAEDLRAVFAVLRGAEACDLRSLAAHVPSRAFPARPRVGFFSSVGAAPVDPRIRAAADGFARALEMEGCSIEPIAAPFDIEEIHAVWATIARPGLAWHLAGHPGAMEQIGENARTMAAAGAGISAIDYVDALARCFEIRSQAGLFLEPYDFILCPAMAALAWPAGDAFPPIINGKPVGPRGHSIFTTWMNLAGVCGTSVPVAIAPDAGGIGMQLTAAAGRDLDLLDFVVNSRAVADCTPDLPFKDMAS